MSPQPDGAVIAQSRARAILRAAFREPLVHFLIAGVAIFLAAMALKASDRPVLRIDERELTQLVAYWQAQSQRPPTPKELAGILRERVDEEILAREAVRLGYDKGDLIVRRRLAQKMAFASEDAEPIREPDEATLRAYYEKTKADYAAPAHMAVRHVVFSADRADARAAAQQALANANAGGNSVGDPFMLPLTYGDVTSTELARDYGPAFAKAAEAAKVGVWTGPVESAYGWHIIRVETRKAARIESFDEARSEVRDAWMTERRAQANAAYLEKLRARYRIEIAKGLTTPMEPAPTPD